MMQSEPKLDGLELIRSGVSLTDSWGNNEKERTLAFRYPPNWHLYVALKNRTFAETICIRIGPVSDCYILCTPKLLFPLQKFYDSDELDLVRKGDEHEYHKPRQREESRKDNDESDVPCWSIHAEQRTTNNLMFGNGSDDNILVSEWILNRL